MLLPPLKLLKQFEMRQLPICLVQICPSVGSTENAKEFIDQTKHNNYIKIMRLDSRVVFTLDYNEHRYAAPWAVRSILGDDHSFSAQA